jgi:hypothetical protein
VSSEPQYQERGTLDQSELMGYRFRKKYRRAMEEWLANVGFRLFVTLSFKQDLGLAERGQRWGTALAASTVII